MPNSSSLTSSALQATVTADGAFPFVRLEDSDCDQRPITRLRPRTYLVDTGTSSVKGGAAACDEVGSICQMDFDPQDAAGPAKFKLVDRSQGASSGWSTPDNVAAGLSSLMVQEDPASATFAGQRAPQIRQFRSAEGGLKNGRAVAELENSACDDVKGTCWESSGIIDAPRWLGPGAWLYDVHAHTLPIMAGDLGLVNEGGQLLLMRIRGS